MKIQPIEEALIQGLIAVAGEKPRRRTNHNFHQDLSENPNRFLNVMLRGTYIRPHRHSQPPKSESFVILSGEVAFFVFADDGSVRQRFDLSSKEGTTRGIDIGPGVWHTIVVLSESAVCFEVKPGPYTESADKEFAVWAPAEGSPDCQVYTDRLLSI